MRIHLAEIIKPRQQAHLGFQNDPGYDGRKLHSAVQILKTAADRLASARGSIEVLKTSVCFDAARDAITSAVSSLSPLSQRLENLNSAQFLEKKFIEQTLLASSLREFHVAWANADESSRHAMLSLASRDRSEEAAPSPKTRSAVELPAHGAPGSLEQGLKFAVADMEHATTGLLAGFKHSTYDQDHITEAFEYTSLTRDSLQTARGALQALRAEPKAEYREETSINGTGIDKDEAVTDA